ncbi:MAG: hypothetical protein R2788_15340 [Saprospiraceae bacterium]
MKILNLSKDFNLPTDNNIRFKSFIFHGGEPHIQLQLPDPIAPQEEVVIPNASSAPMIFYCCSWLPMPSAQWL